MGAEARLTELKLTLPPAPKPVATYFDGRPLWRPALRLGPWAAQPDGSMHLGRLGAGLDVEAGKLAAKQTGLAILATVRATLGSLDKVVRLIKVLGLVNSAPDFYDHPKVINGFSDLMVEVFGEPGKAARSAFGVAALPGNIAVEIEAIFEVKD